MTQVAQDFEIWSGDNKSLVVSVVDGDDAAINIAGASITWKLADVDGNVKISKANDSASEIEITDAANGIFKIYLLPADTASLSGIYNHEAELTDALGNVSTVFVGKANIHTDLVE